MAISDVGTKLYKESATAGKYEKLVSVTSVPATGAAPGTIEVTELDDVYKKYILDRPDTPSYEFEYNYTQENYETVSAAVSLTEDRNYLIIYQDGSGEKFTGKGATWINKVGKGEAVTAGISFAVSSHEHVADTASMISAGE